MKILITGDFALTNNSSDSVHIDSEVINLFSESDLNIVNLEAPITNSDSGILKSGPNIKSNQIKVQDVFYDLKIGAVSLANNHLMDFGENGLYDTIEFCNQNNVSFFGGGKDLEEASKIFYYNSKEGKIAFINFAENEWISAKNNRAGFNPMDIIDNTKKIIEAKKNADYVIVIIHGGHEYYNLPSPKTAKQYRFYAEQGADLIVGHHPHSISGFEEYNQVPIYYSLGNFIFDHNSTKEDWYIGLVLEIEIKDGQLKHNIHIIGQDKKNFNLSLKKGNEKRDIIKRIELYNAIIKDEKQLQEEWDNYINLMTDDYLSYFKPANFFDNKYMKKIIRRLNMNYLNLESETLFLNLIRCEAHSSLLIDILEKRLIDKNK